MPFTEPDKHPPLAPLRMTNLRAFFTTSQSNGADSISFKRSEKTMTKQAPPKPTIQDTKKRPMDEDLDDNLFMEIAEEKLDDLPSTHRSKKTTIIITDDEQEVKPPEPVSPKNLREAAQDTLSHMHIETTKTESIVVPEKKKFSYFQMMQRQSVGARNPGTYTVPEGAPNCLLGLTFVFTGEFCEFSRDDILDYVHRYNGKTTTAPSRRTSFVVVGQDPGASKLEKAKEYQLQVLTEEQFYKLVESLPPRTESGLEMTMEQIHQHKQLEEKQKQKQVTKEANRIAASASLDVFSPAPQFSTHSKPEETSNIWTVKYAPQKPSDIIGNHANIDRLSQWLRGWKRSKTGRSAPEQTAVLISGPPGIGKTTSAVAVSRAEGFEPLEYNASDTRSKKALHTVVKELLSNRSMSEFPSSERTLVPSKRAVLIMDEVDGMSAGDRGGMAELILLIKKTQVPIICICNDRNSPKVRSLANYCLDLRFRRPEARLVSPRISEICKKENISVGQNVIEQLVASTHGDIRQILNILSNWSVGKADSAGILDYDQGKHIAQLSKKDVDQGPFEIVSEFLYRSNFQKHSVSELLELYFMDSSLVPLMIQENYIHCKPFIPAHKDNIPDHLMALEAIERAANAIADSDIISSKIHGATQAWGLSPFHGFMSCVMPSFFASGGLGGRLDFAQWLGLNSKAGKLQRLLTEISVHMCLHISAGKDALRMDYLSPLIALMTEPLIKEAAEGVDKVIRVLDAYTILKEDYDAMLELGIGRCEGEKILSKISTAAKSALTRTYNKETRVLPYAIQSVAIKRGAEIEEEEGVISLLSDEEAGGDDISKDKMIKMGAGKKRGGKTGGRGGKKVGTKKNEDSYDEGDGFVVADEEPSIKSTRGRKHK